VFRGSSNQKKMARQNNTNGDLRRRDLKISGNLIAQPLFQLGFFWGVYIALYACLYFQSIAMLFFGLFSTL